MANEQQLQQLIRDGLSAMKTGSETAAKATASITQAASYPDLKEALQEGSETSKKWAQRIDEAIKEAGAAGDQKPNPIIDGIGKVNQNILDSAPDDYSRDLGIIAGGQLALHYWIAAFGTMASYTKEAGLNDAHKAMKKCADEAGDADDEHTKIAKHIMDEK